MLLYDDTYFVAQKVHTVSWIPHCRAKLSSEKFTNDLIQIGHPFQTLEFLVIQPAYQTLLPPSDERSRPPLLLLQNFILPK